MAREAVRSRSSPGGAKTLDIYADAQCSCILLPFFALELSRGPRLSTCFYQLCYTADRAPVDINLALTLVTSATITIALQLQLLLDILISEEVLYLDSFT